MPPAVDDRLAPTSQRCLAWMTSASIVFPLAVLIVAGLALVTEQPTWGIVASMVIAVVPWGLLALGARVPSLVVVAVTTVATAALVLRYNGAAAMFLAVVMIAWAAAEGYTLASIVGFVAGVLIVVQALVSDHDNFQHSGAVSWITGLAMGWFLGLLVNRQRKLTNDLDTARDELALAAIREERALVAREVHDIVGHGLTVALLNISGARRHLAKNAATAAEALDRAEIVTRESLETVRNAVGLLSSENQRFQPMPGGGDVASTVEQARESGLPVTLSLVGNPAELEPAVGLTLVRLLQESLSNANRHAPGAPIEVVLTVGDSSVTATISNPMPPVDPTAPTSRRGIGLASMRDRVAAARGTLDVGPRGDRWLVHCNLPRRAQAGPDTVVQLGSA